MREGCSIRALGDILTFDKKFNGIPKERQGAIARFHHVSAEELKALKVDNGNVKLIYTGQFDGFTTEKLAGSNLNRGEIITIPTGGTANIKYYSGLFVDSGNLIGVARDKSICLKYVFYGMTCKKEVINSYYRGVSIKHPYMPDICKITLPIPSVQQQNKIVAEFDCLTDIITKKKQQLEELDKLAQSIFYDMFGDPITNERGWEVKSLEKVVHKECPISYGIVQPMEDVQDGVPIVRPIDLTETFIKPDGLKKTAREISNSYKRTILRGDEILVCVRGTTGVVACADITLRGCNTTRGITPLFFDERNERWFMFSLFRAPSFRHLIEEKTYGIALKQINIRDLKLLPIIQPSVSMQQLFARKVEAIERQRELVKRSIGETETLFNSRMEYWFNN